MLPEDSVNQQQLPDGSKAKAVGVLLAVGIVHSVKVAVVAIANTDPAGKRAGKTSKRDRIRTGVPLIFNPFTT